MLLTHLGFKIDFINWVMGCISSVSFAVLINGAASPFFKGKRGLRQGCPLSPLLFLLVAEGLSQLLLKAKREGSIKGLEVAGNLFITHLLFVDDILLFCNGSLFEFKKIKEVLELFMRATGMLVNYRKSQLITEGLNRQEISQLTAILPLETSKLGDPFKYLGFWLKPDNYKKQDWSWLVAKIEARITHWSFRWISRAGRLTLIKSVLLATPIFWASLSWVPRGILGKIRRICTRFLWAGAKEESVVPWIAWDKVARPKEWGGWGIKDLNAFTASLAANSGWRIVNENYALSPGLIRHLASKGIVYLNQVEKIGSSSIWGQAWKTVEELNIHPRWWDEWETFKQELSRSNVRIKDGPDQLIWAYADTGSYSPKFGYKFLMSKKGWGDPEWWEKSLWKLKCPAKAKLFFWCILKKKVPTWDILQSRHKQGPGRCTLCKNDLETTNHLFIEFQTAKKVWSEVSKYINLSIQWEGQSLTEAWQNWWNQISDKKLRNMPPIICWGIWIARNRNIFQDKETEAVQIRVQCLSIYSNIPDSEDEKEPRKVEEEQIKEGVP
eukprot:PITA_02842